MTKHFSPLVGKPSTGEPDAGEPHVRFGGRGGATQCVVPTPIIKMFAFNHCESVSENQKSHFH